MTRPPNEKVAQALLGSFSQDEAPVQAKERALTAFGITAGVASVTTTAISAAADVASAAAPGAAIAAKSAALVGGFSLVKAVIAGAALGAIVMHASERMASDSRETRASSDLAAEHRAATPTPLSNGGGVVETPNPAPAPMPPLTSVTVPSEPAIADPPPAVVARAILAQSASVQRSPADVPSRTRAAPIGSTDNSAAATAAAEETPAATNPAAPAMAAEASAATLTGEVVRLDRARAALREGSPSRAMWELDGYDAEFAHGSLRQEAGVLRIELLVEMGDDVRARALADAFAAAHPRSGYLNKIQELLARRPKRRVP